MKNIQEIIDSIQKNNPQKFAVAAADDDVVLETICRAKKEGIADAILVGDTGKIKQVAQNSELDISSFEIVHVEGAMEAALKAAALVRDGEADIVMKGMLETAQFMKAILSPESRLRLEGRTISSIVGVELKKENRMLYLTDVGFIPTPDLELKRKIIENAVEVLQQLGIRQPKVATLCAIEKVNPKMQATVDAQALRVLNETGSIKNCILSGPISLDLAISQEAAAHKKFHNPVAGKADVLVVPALETGNALAKTFDYLTDCKTISIVTGAKAPICFTSRATSPERRYYAVAFAAYIAQKKKERGN